MRILCLTEPYLACGDNDESAGELVREYLQQSSKSVDLRRRAFILQAKEHDPVMGAAFTALLLAVAVGFLQGGMR